MVLSRCRPDADTRTTQTDLKPMRSSRREKWISYFKVMRGTLIGWECISCSLKKKKKTRKTFKHRQRLDAASGFQRAKSTAGFLMTLKNNTEDGRQMRPCVFNEPACFWEYHKSVIYTTVERLIVKTEQCCWWFLRYFSAVWASTQDRWKEQIERCLSLIKVILQSFFSLNQIPNSYLITITSVVYMWLTLIRISTPFPVVEEEPKTCLFMYGTVQTF